MKLFRYRFSRLHETYESYLKYYSTNENGDTLASLLWKKIGPQN